MTVDKIVLQIEVDGSLLSLFTYVQLAMFYIPEEISVPVCYSVKGPSTQLQ